MRPGSRCGQTVKALSGGRSNGQAVCWGTIWRSRGVADPFAHAQLIDGQGSRAKIRRGQAVKAIFQRSKILTLVAALDTAPMRVIPPWEITEITTPAKIVHIKFMALLHVVHA